MKSEEEWGVSLLLEELLETKLLPSPHITLSVVVVKASSKTEPQASVLWTKLDSFEHILDNEKAFEDAMLPTASG